MKFKQYLETTFPLLELKGGIFYDWNYAIRFEIGDPEIGIWQDTQNTIINRTYFTEALKRATILFEATFNQEDDVFLVFQKYSKGREKIQKQSYCFQSVKKIHDLEEFRVKNLYDDKEKGDWHRVVISSCVKDIDYATILSKSIYVDFGQKALPTFFINKTQNIIYHLYDDRGLDIITQDKISLQKLYKEYNHWILEYNRVEIDKIFKKEE